jgi:hypothetical protein
MKRFTATTGISSAAECGCSSRKGSAPRSGACQERVLLNGDASWFTGTGPCSGFDNQALSHRLFGRERLRVGFGEVVATLGPSCSVIIQSLLMYQLRRHR